MAFTVDSQSKWEKLITTLDFNIPTRMILKNTLFENADNQLLTLSLDTQFSSMLTDTIQKSIQTTLEETFGDIKLNISTNELKRKTLAQKEMLANNEKTDARQKAYLADEGVQKLQQVFNAKIDLNSIKESENV